MLRGYFNFQNGASTVVNGGEYIVKDMDNVISFEVSGNGTYSIIFEGKNNENGTYYSIGCLNQTDAKIYTATSTNGLFEMNCYSLYAVRVRIVSITGGSITVTGRVCA